MSDKKIIHHHRDYCFAVQYNNLPDQEGQDRFLIVRKELVEQHGSDLFTLEPEELPSFLRKKHFAETEYPFVYEKMETTEMVYESLLELGLDEDETLLGLLEEYEEAIFSDRKSMEEWDKAVGNDEEEYEYEVEDKDG